MKYNLYDIEKPMKGKKGLASILKKFSELIQGEKKNLFFSLLAIVVNSGLNLLGPLLIGIAIDKYVATKQMHGVWVYSGILLAIYLVGFFANYVQMQLMGAIGQRMMYKLRNNVFVKLQELPVAFFNQNKAGDLISRVNNDTDKLNQFFSQSLMRFLGFIVTMIGSGIFLLSINPELGAAALIPAVFILLFTKVISPWVKKKNKQSLESMGGMSGEIQESLDNFKTIIAFNRRDYFRQKFEKANQNNYKKSVGAGVANTLLMPVYSFFTSMAQLVVLTFGIYLIAMGNFTIGFLISFLAYVNRFYNPIRQLAALWASLQSALAAWERITSILNLKNDMQTVPSHQPPSAKMELEFKNVSFGYDENREVLKNINFKLEKGKTYAFIGPTGGGKSTSASLIARLYDPTKGEVLLDGLDIKSYSDEQRSQKIGFILQEPFLFNGTVKENILFGNRELEEISDEQLAEKLTEAHLDVLLEKFEEGLSTPINVGANSLSLGQKQLIAFIRAVLRQPDILILDEATANIDTVTEKLLDEILARLPEATTRVIIAHRLNTIANADEIFFVNAGEIIPAGSMENAMEMLMSHKRAS